MPRVVVVEQERSKKWKTEEKRKLFLRLPFISLDSDLNLCNGIVLYNYVFMVMGAEHAMFTAPNAEAIAFTAGYTHTHSGMNEYMPRWMHIAFIAPVCVFCIHRVRVQSVGSVVCCSGEGTTKNVNIPSHKISDQLGASRVVKVLSVVLINSESESAMQEFVHPLSEWKITGWWWTDCLYLHLSRTSVVIN